MLFIYHLYHIESIVDKNQGFIGLMNSSAMQLNIIVKARQLLTCVFVCLTRLFLDIWREIAKIQLLSPHVRWVNTLTVRCGFSKLQKIVVSG